MRSKNLGGRPPRDIDLKQVEGLASIQCTYEEMAAVLGMSKRQLLRRAKTQAFLEAVERGNGLGRVSLKRAQHQAAVGGNVTMQIWLGKQILGQRDVTATELSGPAGAPIEHHVSVESARDKLARALAEGSERIAASTQDETPEADG